jgi:hypothetical protein
MAESSQWPPRRRIKVQISVASSAAAGHHAAACALYRLVVERVAHRDAWSKKGAAGGGQFNAVHAASHQLDTDLIFEISDLTTEGRLRRVQLFRSRDRQASGLGNRDEVAKVPQLHRSLPYLQGMVPSLQSLFLRR